MREEEFDGILFHKTAPKKTLPRDVYRQYENCMRVKSFMGLASNDRNYKTNMFYRAQFWPITLD